MDAVNAMPEDRMSEYLDTIDAAADWTPVTGDVDRAWTMAAHLCKMHRYDLDAYIRWGRACINGLCTEDELNRYLDCYQQADALGISWRAWVLS